MNRLSGFAIATSFLATSLGPVTAQEVILPPLIGEEVVRARVVALRPSGTLAVSFNGTEEELRLDSIRLPSQKSSSRNEADVLLRNRLLGKSVEVHIRTGRNRDEIWLGYALHDGSDVRLELVAKGLAMYCRDRRRETEFEVRDQQAREAGKGIWAKDEEDVLPRCEDAARP